MPRTCAGPGYLSVHATEITRRLTALMTGTQKQPWRALQGI
jgi:hypothetical protein